MDYRREIDGLRALAVLPVILFHAGLETFGGGFVGVDVFFVISGYLITTIILGELEQGKFSIANFYERRARRILPALFLVMFICIPFAWLWLFPSDMKGFSKSLVYVSIFASNFLFLRESGYFDAAAELKPLLHTWSLAVEEQYYILFPLFLMLFWKLGKRWILITLGLAFVVSLGYAQWAVLMKPSAAFFLLLTRAWELLTGAFAAFYLSQANRNNWSKELSELCGWLGVSLIIFSVLTYSKATPFPGLYALVPTVGSVLIILFATQETTVGKFVGNKVFVGVGLISYSAYLWHQPLFAFARHAGTIDSEILIYLSFVSFLLAYLSWKFVEVPFRNKERISRRTIFIFAICGSLFFFCLGTFGSKNNGDIGQLNAKQKTFLAYFENDFPAWRYFIKQGIPEKFREDCNFYNLSENLNGNSTSVPLERISESCYTRSQQKSKVVFIWGDSHAQQLYYGLSNELPKDFEVLQVASSGCKASFIANESKVNYCEHSNWFAYNIIQKLKPEVVIIGQNLEHDILTMKNISEKLKSVGVDRVIFTGPSPHWIPSLPVVLARNLANVPERTFSGVDRGVLELDKKLKIQSDNLRNFDYVSLVDFFCNKQGCLTHYTSDISTSITTWDYGHLTPIASNQFAKEILVPRIVKR
jgi:peptidoglycan/LPS O-acetylase OafA/YrhL